VIDHSRERSDNVVRTGLMSLSMNAPNAKWLHCARTKMLSKRDDQSSKMSIASGGSKSVDIDSYI
jgi:hypothetical protein